MKKILTIGIPTYNGAPHIRETLDSILSQDPNILDSKVEILISDNASTDETELIVREYSSKHPNLIRYSKNEINIGFDRNLDMLFKKANGAYVWLMGDDDALLNP